MKKLLASALLFCSLTATAGSLPEAPHLYVQGQAKLQVKPDRATIRMAINDQQMQVADAKRNVDAVMAKAIGIAKKFNIIEKDIHAEQLNVYRQNTYNRETNQQEFAGFRVTRTLNLTLSDVDKYPELLQALVEAGVNEFYDTQFSVAEHNNILKTVQKAAIKDAKLAAKELAKDFDVKLGKLYSVSFAPMDTPVVPFLRAQAKMMDAESSNVGNAYNTGYITIDAQVYAVYFID
ncbi:SIMPL domain-containing protein [Pseudoalteromonas fenneropenaei]|uniref:SIMPL domain-containing protein n=1 Tax=Pseudoalteromonas fenneropenaei TaxID=1737459 RepID=A0ABV7CFK4_9GAMM